MLKKCTCRLLLSLVVFCTATTIGISQKLPPILQVTKYEKGIYKTYDEFLMNAPSIKVDFNLLVRAKRIDVISKDSLIDKKIIRACWGVSTGDTIYANVSNYSKASGFVQLLKLGRYCYFKGWGSLGFTNTYPQNVGMGGGGTTAGLSYTSEEAFAFNINNGHFFMATKTVMEQILKKDEVLLAEYASEKRENNPDVMLSYIEKYNAKHTDEIGKEKIIQIFLYRRDQKERIDTIGMHTGDSVQFRIAPNDFRKMYSTDKSIILCVENDCNTFNLNIHEINYFECSYKEKDAKPMIMKKEKKVGEFYMKEIRYNLEKVNSSN